MTIIFLKSSLKIGIFSTKSKNFYFLYKTLECGKFESAHFKPDKGFLERFVQEYRNKSFLFPNLIVFVFLLNSAIRQIPESWFQIWQICFEILFQKYPNKASNIANLNVFGSS